MLARYTKRETLCFLLKLSTSEMSERKTLLLIHNFLNYLIDKFTPPAHERGISLFSVLGLLLVFIVLLTEMNR